MRAMPPNLPSLSVMIAADIGWRKSIFHVSLASMGAQSRRRSRSITYRVDAGPRRHHRRTVMRIKVSASACAFTGAFPYRALAISFTALLFAILPVAQHCSAQESWIDQRQVAFARWQAANPNSQSAIADYLKKSAQLIALPRHPTDDATPVVWQPGTQSLTLWEGPKFP